MKPPKFAYHVPETLEEAIRLKDELGFEGTILAGGQSLLPMLNMRLARPDNLIDLRKLDGLSGITVTEHGTTIGAMTRQRTVELDADVANACPLLPEAIRLIAHSPIRNRGTIGGSIAHADPAAELPAVLTLLDGAVTVEGPNGSRAVPASEFFQFHLTTVLEENEIVTAVFFPALPSMSGCAIVELSRRSGDFALVGAAALVDDVSEVVCFSGVGPKPIRVASSNVVDWQDAVAPVDDIHATAAHRRELVSVLGRRSLELAHRRREDQ